MASSCTVNRFCRDSGCQNVRFWGIFRGMMRLREMAVRLQEGRLHQQMHFQAVTLSPSLAGEGGIARTMDLLPGLGLPLAKEV